jgi:hypothetical protein
LVGERAVSHLAPTVSTPIGAVVGLRAAEQDERV